MTIVNDFYPFWMPCTADRRFETGVPVRAAGDTTMLSPPLTIEPAEIDRIMATIGDGLDAID